MAIVRGNVQKFGPSTSGPTATLNTPTGLSNGDVIVWLFVAVTATAITVSYPSGFTQQYASGVIQTTLQFFIATHVVTDAASEPATYAFGLGGVTPGGHSGVLVAYSGVDNTTPQDVAAASAISSATTIATPSITTVTAGAMIISMAASRSTSRTMSTAAVTEFYDIIADVAGAQAADSHGGGDAVQASAGASGTKSWTVSGATGSNAGVTWALRPAAARKSLVFCRLSRGRRSLLTR